MEHKSKQGAPDAEGEISVRRLSPWEKLYQCSAFRKGTLLLLIALAWQGYGTALGNKLMFPTLTDTLWGLAEAVQSGELPARIAVSLRVIFFSLTLSACCWQGCSPSLPLRRK